ATSPDSVRALVAINTFGWPPEQPALRRMLRFVGGRPFRSFNVATNLVPRLTATKGGVGRHLDRAARDAFLAPYRARPDVRRTFHALMHDAATDADLMAPVEQALAGALHDRPLLTIFGERNDPFGFQDRWGLLMPNGQHEVVAGGNHFPMADAPDDVARWIRDWMEETGAEHG
ncbi:MAG: alpha/beta hydrolase, partial [Nitriliruptorales bacterium]|nr:alpha/beta hydrolase [Nitriliruptorales bacterium]